MAKAVASKSQSKTKSRPRIELPPGKGAELAGLVVLSLALFLAASLVSYQPRDPSVFHGTVGSGVEAPSVDNWVGRVGAHVAAVSFGLLGLAALGIPLVLGVMGVRRLRGGTGGASAVRLVGVFLVLLALPALLELVVGEVPWRGEPGGISSGGAFGALLAEALTPHLAFAGTLMLLLATVLVGATLAIQSTLGEVARGWARRGASGWSRFQLARERRAQRRAKEKARRRVVAKHVQRVREEREEQGAGDGAAAAPAPPPRVVERRGEPRFGVRRVAGEPEVHQPGPVSASSGSSAYSASAPPSPAGTSRSAPLKPVAAYRPTPFEPESTPAPSQGKLGGIADQIASGRGGTPPLNLLQQTNDQPDVDSDELVRLGELIKNRCAEFGVEGTIEGISPGPVITVFEFQPAPGVKVSQIVNLQDELALALKAASVRIERLAGRSTLGIEVPNEIRQVIPLGKLLANDSFAKARSPLTMALGVDIHGEPYYADLATMPHLLVAGATGAGKSVGLQAMITSIMYKATPEAVRFIFIDPKRIELGVYADIPNLETRVVVEPQQAANVLSNMVAEMERRYKLLAEVHVRSIAYYNSAIRDPEQRKRLALDEEGSEFSAEDFQPLPYFVIIIDELADLMMVASSDVETAIARLAQMARAVGIHLIVATQRPSVDVLTGTIKANFPCRISFATATRHDSRTILDQVGSEQLLGKGDALFMPPGTSRIMRLHGAYVSEQETAGLVRWLKRQAKPDYNLDLLESRDKGRSGSGDLDDADDELYDEAARLVVSEGSGSASFLQRRLRVGFSRASRLIDMMEQDGLLGPPQGSKPRDVLVSADYFAELDAARME